ncbi:transporter [Niveibacterium sp. SC-1]|uniref:transporter n=1 Tax=Niveibacterium sp. SC-1 TaxID=3135646 RepID=UPI00311EFB42
MEWPLIKTRVRGAARPFSGAWGLRGTVGLCVLLGWAARPVHAQSIEPRSYSNAPVGVNFLLGGIAHSGGGVPSDPALPITNPKLEIWSGFAGFAHVFDAGGQSGTWALLVPYADLSGEADYQGREITREQSGVGDVLARVAINLIGAPALDPKEFARYEQDLIIGASFAVSAPTGAYDGDRLVNIGAHRWTIKSELGASQAIGNWVVETSAAVSVFTDNTEFNGGQTREQDPIYSLQLHTIYTFRPGLWISGSVTYYGGGRTSLNGVAADDLQDNWRAGATLSVPIARGQSIKLSGSNGVSARTGNNFSLLALSWQMLWNAW